MQIIPENLVPRLWYREVRTRAEVPEPVPRNRRNRGFITETGTELKNKYCPNTNINMVSFAKTTTVYRVIFVVRLGVASSYPNRRQLSNNKNKTPW